MRIPRSRGAVSGVALVILGLWGGLIPFVGPYFNYSVGTDHTWVINHNRWWLDVLPAAAVVLGGILLLFAASRASGSLGGWLALAGGLWFVIGPTVSRLWEHGAVATGAPLGTSTTRQILEQLGYYQGLGVVVASIASFALGRMAVRSVRDAELTEEHNAARKRNRRGAGAVPAGGRGTGRTSGRAATAPAPAAPGRGASTREPAAGEPAAPPSEQSTRVAGEPAREPVAEDPPSERR